MANNKNQARQMKLDIGRDVAAGVYSNLAIISHTPTEFCIDFAQVLPGAPDQAPVRSRIIMAPVHARNFLSALTENIQRYEQQFGRIPAPAPAPDSDTIPFDMLPQGEA